MSATRTFGPAYDREIDGPRLATQMVRVRGYMLSSFTPDWLTMAEVAEGLARLYPGERFPVQSVDAQRRHLKKTKFGRYRCEKRRRGGERSGLWEYRLLPPIPEAEGGQTRLF